MDRRLPLALSLLTLACSPGGIGVTGEGIGDGGSETGGGETGGSETGSSETGEDEDCEFVVPDEQVIADLDAIVTGTLAWFAEAHPLEGLDYDGKSYAPHRCPHPDGSSTGHAGMTPQLNFDCNGGPDHLCVPWHGDWMEVPNEPGYYDGRWWFLNDVWLGVGFEKTEAHAFHYDLFVDNQPDEYGSCTFTASAYGDLDADYVFSTYERRGIVDQDGVKLEPLLIESPCE